MADIKHRIGIKAPVSKVYQALSTIEGNANWWTKNTTGNSIVGGKINFLFKTPEGSELGAFDMEVKKLDENKTVQWTVINGPEDWIGTDLTFNLNQEDDYTIILFSHSKWREANDHMSHCSMKWATFLLSLRQYVETGKGRPSPDDLKIDNWN